MSALTPTHEAFLDANPVGVLATPTRSGRPRQSLVYYAREGEQLLISTLQQRLKARDVDRSGWASLCVMAHEPPFASAVFAGPAEIVTAAIGPGTAKVMQKILGADAAPAPEQTDEALAAVGRVLLRITVERVTAESYLPQVEPAR